jgi:hypothetical protein
MGFNLILLATYCTFLCITHVLLHCTALVRRQFIATACTSYFSISFRLFVLFSYYTPSSRVVARLFRYAKQLFASD